MRERERERARPSEENKVRGGWDKSKRGNGSAESAFHSFQLLIVERTELLSWVAQTHKHRQIVVLRTSLPFSPSVCGVQSAPAEARALSAALQMGFAFKHWNMGKIHPMKKKENNEARLISISVFH